MSWRAPEHTRSSHPLAEWVPYHVPEARHLFVTYDGEVLELYLELTDLPKEEAVQMDTIKMDFIDFNDSSVDDIQVKVFLETEDVYYQSDTVEPLNMTRKTFWVEELHLVADFRDDWDRTGEHLKYIQERTSPRSTGSEFKGFGKYTSYDIHFLGKYGWIPILDYNSEEGDPRVPDSDRAMYEEDRRNLKPVVTKAHQLLAAAQNKGE